MKKNVRRWMLAAALTAAGCCPWMGTPSTVFAVPGGQTSVAAGTELATVEQLKAEAFKALRGGEFTRVSELLSEARGLSQDDPTLGKMVDWSKAFETQRQEFAAERLEQYTKAVEDVKKLQD